MLMWDSKPFLWSNAPLSPTCALSIRDSHKNCKQKFSCDFKPFCAFSGEKARHFWHFSNIRSICLFRKKGAPQYLVVLPFVKSKYRLCLPILSVFVYSDQNLFAASYCFSADCASSSRHFCICATDAARKFERDCCTSFSAIWMASSVRRSASSVYSLATRYISRERSSAFLMISRLFSRAAPSTSVSDTLFFASCSACCIMRSTSRLAALT